MRLTTLQIDEPPHLSIGRSGITCIAQHIRLSDVGLTAKSFDVVLALFRHRREQAPALSHTVTPS